MLLRIMEKFYGIRKYLHFPFLLFLFACSNLIAEKEEAFIRLRISMHNAVFLEFVKDSINKRKEIWDSIYYPGKSKYIVSVITDSIIGTLYKDNNIPYNPNGDDHLTYAKFMDWCSQKRLDPVKTAGDLKIKNDAE